MQIDANGYVRSGAMHRCKKKRRLMKFDTEVIKDRQNRQKFLIFSAVESRTNREARNASRDPAIVHACKILIYITTGIRNTGGDEVITLLETKEHLRDVGRVFHHRPSFANWTDFGQTL